MLHGGNSAAGAISFKRSGTFNVGGSYGDTPVSVVDVNRDGIPDIVDSGQTPDGRTSLAVLLGKGDGTFRQVIHNVPFYDPWYGDAAIADVNRDGKLDAVVPSIGPNAVSVLLGAGTGHFRYSDSYFAGYSVRTVRSVDLNADAIADLVTGNEDEEHFPHSYSVSVLIGDGDGGFGRNVDFSTVDPKQMLAADLNRDARPDLIVGGGNGNGGYAGRDLSLLLSDDRARFRTRRLRVAASESSIEGIALGDLDRDGKADLVVTASANNSSVESYIKVLAGDGHGGFRLKFSRPLAHSPAFVSVTDMDRDGKPDVVVASAYWETMLTVFRGKGDGTLWPAQTFPDLEVYPRSMTVADVSRDGKPDVIVTDFYFGYIDVILNTSP